MTDFGTPGSFPTPPMPPSSGDRTGPPWEQPGAFFQRWLDTAKSILLDPMNGFRNVRRTGGLGAPLDLLRGRRRAGDPRHGPVPVDRHRRLDDGRRRHRRTGGLLGGLGMIGVLLFMVWFVLGFFIGTGIVHLVLSLLGGAKHGYEATARTFAYAYGSAVPIAIVPICGGAIAGIWALVCVIMGLANMQETTPVKAAIAIFAPLVLCCVVMSCSGARSWR